MSKYWIGVASKEHVDKGVKDGFMQLCHGRHRPLSKIKKGDRILYYSPNKVFGKRDNLKSFTAVGKVVDNNIYKVKIDDTFEAWRKDVEFDKEIKSVKIKPIIEDLSFIENKEKWGVYFRSGVKEISKTDYEVIYNKMKEDDETNSKE